MSPYHGWPFLSWPGHPFLSALWEVLAHGSISLIVIAPLLRWSGSRRRVAGLALVAGLGLDLDHAVAARSLSLMHMESLHGRPPTHSLLFAAAVALVIGMATRRPSDAWVVLAALIGHLLFDAAGGGTRWLYPADLPTSVPWIAAPVGVAVLAIASWRIARRYEQQSLSRSAPRLG